MCCPEMSDEIRHGAWQIRNFDIADFACRSSFILCCCVIFIAKIDYFRDVGRSAFHLCWWSLTRLMQECHVAWKRAGCQVAGQEHSRTIKQCSSNIFFIKIKKKIKIFNKTAMTWQVTWLKSSQVTSQEGASQSQVKSFVSVGQASHKSQNWRLESDSSQVFDSSPPISARKGQERCFDQP